MATSLWSAAQREVLLPHWRCEFQLSPPSPATHPPVSAMFPAGRWTV
ncbi:hypothetical protein [Micromonospora sp. NPDC051296]